MLLFLIMDGDPTRETVNVPKIETHTHAADENIVRRIENPDLKLDTVVICADRRPQVLAQQIPEDVDPVKLLDGLSRGLSGNTAQEVIESYVDILDGIKPDPKEIKFSYVEWEGASMVLVDQGVATFVVPKKHRETHEARIKLVRDGVVYTVGRKENIVTGQEVNNHFLGKVNLQKGDKIIIGDIATGTIEEAIEQGRVSSPGSLSRQQASKNSPEYRFGSGYMHEPSVSVISVGEIDAIPQEPDSFSPYTIDMLEDIRHEDLTQQERGQLVSLLEFAKEYPEMAQRAEDAIYLYASQQSGKEWNGIESPAQIISEDMWRSELRNIGEAKKHVIEQMEAIREKIQAFPDEEGLNLLQKLRLKALGLRDRIYGARLSDLIATERELVDDIPRPRDTQFTTEEISSLQNYTLDRLIGDLGTYEGVEFSGTLPENIGKMNPKEMYKLFSKVWKPQPSADYYYDYPLTDEKLRGAILSKLERN